jgi:hypothetical protein
MPLDPTPMQMLPTFAAAKTIPKIIHQVYFSKALPPILEQNVAKLKHLNPGWEYRFYDDDDMVEYIRSAYGSEMLGYYTRINPKYGASRADLFRYLLIYREGGVYLDIKGSMDKPLDEVLNRDDVYLLSRWPAAGSRYAGWGEHRQLKHVGGEEFQQWHIIAAPGHPFLRAVIERVRDHIDRYNPLIHDTGREGVLWVTGPIAYTQSIIPLLHLYPHRLCDSQADLGLIYSVYGASSGGRPHTSLFKFHYTALTEPVTELANGRRLLWQLAGPVHVHIIRPLREVRAAIMRRLGFGPVRSAQAPP